MTNTSINDKSNAFFNDFKPVSYKRGQVIMRPYEDLNSIIYLKSGSVKMYALSEDGDEITLHVFRPNSFFPVMLLLTDRENTYYYEASEDSQGIIAPQEKVLKWVKSNPEILLDLTTRFSQAILGLLTRLEGMAFQSAYIKLVSLLVYLADKFGEKSENEVYITLLLNHQDIASWISIRRETASRQLERLQKEGFLVMKEQHFVIPDITKLKNVINITAE